MTAGPMIRLPSCDTVSDLYVRSCQWKGRQILFEDDRGVAFSGDDALNRSLRFASALDAMGVAAGEVVAFLCLGSATHAVAWFGTVSGGRVACNLHVRGETAERIADTLKWLDARVVVCDAELAELASLAIEHSKQGIHRIVVNGPAIDADLFDDILSRHEPYDYANRRPEKDSIGAIALSSGSTGNPKGIIHSQYSLLESSRGGQNVFECVSTDDTFLVVMNPSFAAWLMFVLTSMGGKARTFLCGRFEPEKAMEIIQRERVTITALVPTMWRMVLDAGAEQYDLSSLRLVTVGGEAPTATDVSRVRASICRRVTGTYMASESGTASTIVSRTEDLVERGKIGSTGLPAIGADLKIVDPLGNIEDELAIGETGEIVVSGPSIALGYWKEPVLTEKKFVKGWWRSGDLGHLDADGYLWVNGRVDNVINTGGIKVHAEEVEAALGSHPSISQCAVVGRTDAQFGQRIEAFLIVRDPTVSAESIKAYLKDTVKLGGFKIPKVFHFVSSLPLGKTGKVDRRLLRDGWVEETRTST